MVLLHYGNGSITDSSSNIDSGNANLTGSGTIVQLYQINSTNWNSYISRWFYN